jgi:glycosyltransferase involved in cell wall biosynthesis
MTNQTAIDPTSPFNQWCTQPTATSPDLTVVIPAYNEATRIIPTIAAVGSYLATEGFSFEIVVSDDGSTDNTVAALEALNLCNLHIIAPGINRGKGAAVRAGVQVARGKMILFTDADMSTPIEELAPMLAKTAGNPIVIASRAAEGSMEQNRSGLRQLLSNVLRMLARVILGLGFADTQCGFKLFRADVAKELFAAQLIDGFSFDLELLWLAQRKGYPVAEVGVSWFDAPGSKVAPLRTSMGFLASLIGIRLRHKLHRGGSRPTSGLRVALVSALPPSRTTLNEYGHHLAKHLSENESVQSLTVWTETSLPDETAAMNPSVICQPVWHFNSILNPFRVLAAARKSRPDVVMFNLHFTSFGNARVPAAVGLVTPALLRLFGFRTNVLLHNLMDTVDLDQAGFKTSRFAKPIIIGIGRLLTRVVLLADTVGTTIPTYVDILQDRYSAKNVYLAPHGTFETSDECETDSSDGKRRILAFGKFGTYKRVDGLLDAHAQLLADDEFSDVELLIAGSNNPNAPGYLESLEAQLEDNSQVRFWGYVQEDDVPELFKSASVVAFPYTATTGSSGPLHQAGAYGRAAIVPRVGDFVDLIEDEGFEGEIFDPVSTDSLVVALKNVLGDDARRDELGRTNFAAANRLPLSEVVQWHVDQFDKMVCS